MNRHHFAAAAAEAFGSHPLFAWHLLLEANAFIKMDPVDEACMCNIPVRVPTEITIAQTHLAVMNKSFKVLNKLADARPYILEYPLPDIAVEENKPEVVTWILEKQQSGVIRRTTIRNIGNSAALRGKLDILRLFRLEDLGSGTMQSACKGGQVQVVQFLLSHGWQYDDKYTKPRCILSAAANGHFDLAHWLNNLR